MSTFIVNSSSSNSVSESRNASQVDDVKTGGDRPGGVSQTFGLARDLRVQKLTAV